MWSNWFNLFNTCKLANKVFLFINKVFFFLIINPSWDLSFLSSVCFSCVYPFFFSWQQHLDWIAVVCELLAFLLLLLGSPPLISISLICLLLISFSHCLLLWHKEVPLPPPIAVIMSPSAPHSVCGYSETAWAVNGTVHLCVYLLFMIFFMYLLMITFNFVYMPPCESISQV